VVPEAGSADSVDFVVRSADSVDSVASAVSAADVDWESDAPAVRTDVRRVTVFTDEADAEPATAVEVSVV
jgi:hypothetical protein